MTSTKVVPWNALPSQWENVTSVWQPAAASGLHAVSVARLDEDVQVLGVPRDPCVMLERKGAADQEGDAGLRQRRE